MTSFRHLHQPTSRELQVDNKDYLFFGGTAYLGLLVDDEWQNLVIEGIRTYGLNNGTSRSNNVQLGIYDEAEDRMANRFDYEAAALFSSGYLAAQATVRSLGGRAVYYAPDTHPALWIGDKTEVLASTFEEWSVQVVQRINASTDEHVVIISNAIDNLKPALYDFSFLADISSSKKVTLVLDDSHGLGIRKLNATSANIAAIQGAAHVDVVLVASLAKGFGTDAGLVLANKENIAKVKSNPIFMGASPSSPAFIYALTKGDHIYERSFHRLHRNIEYFSQHISSIPGLVSAPDFPVFTSTDPDLYRFLIKKGVLISSFPYPLPHSPLLNRVVISALHTQEDLLKLTSLLQEYGE